jgi:glycerol kinase
MYQNGSGCACTQPGDITAHSRIDTGCGHAFLQADSSPLLNPLRVPKVTEAACLGAAMLAAAGVGTYPDLKAAAKAAVQFDRRIEPNP